MSPENKRRVLEWRPLRNRGLRALCRPFNICYVFHSIIRWILPFIFSYKIPCSCLFSVYQIRHFYKWFSFWIQYVNVLCRYFQPIPEPVAPVNEQRGGCACWSELLNDLKDFSLNSLAQILQILFGLIRFPPPFVHSIWYTWVNHVYPWCCHCSLYTCGSALECCI
jgi:hypothetical protein